MNKTNEKNERETTRKEQKKGKYKDKWMKKRQEKNKKRKYKEKWIK